MVSAAALLFFFVVLVSVRSEGVWFAFDQIVSTFVPYVQYAPFTFLAVVLAFVFDTQAMVAYSLLIALFCWWRGRNVATTFFAVVMLLNAALLLLVKNIVGRERPVLQVMHETGFSFPSGHSMSALVFFGLLLYLLWGSAMSARKRLVLSGIAVILVLFVGASRIYLNVHWLSDVIAGFLLGISLLGASILVLRRITGKVF